jgi:predicted acetyltransferase
MLKLILPKEKYWQSFQKGVEEFKKHPTPYDTNGITCGLKFANFTDFNLNTENNRLGIGLKEGYVKKSRLWLIEDEKFVGAFDIRHSLTEELIKKGGNIAYYIIPSARKKGLATSGLKLCCEYANKELSLNKVLVTCNSNNLASYKTMLKVMNELGGQEDTPVVFDDKVEKRVWITTKDLL